MAVAEVLRINHRATGTVVNSGAATTLSPAVPAGAVPGDLMIMTVQVRTATAQTFTVPAGWTQRLNVNAQSPVLAVFTKTCVSGDPGTAQAVSWQTSAFCGAVVTSLSGVDVTDPILQIASGSSTGTTVQYGELIVQNEGMQVGIAAGSSTNGITTDSLFTNTVVVNHTTNGAINVGLTNRQRLLFSRNDDTPTGTVAAGTSQGCSFLLRQAPTPYGLYKNDNTTAAITGTVDADEGTSPTADLTSPLYTRIGDILIAAISVGGTPTITPPANWNLVVSQVWNTTFRTSVYWHRATVEGATTHSFSWTGGANGTGVIAAFFGVDPNNPIDASASQANASSTSLTAPTITTTVANTRLLFIGSNQSSNMNTGPAGMAVPFVGGGTSRVALSDEGFPVAGPTGSRVATLASAVANAGILLALRPALSIPRVRAAVNNYSAGPSHVAPVPIHVENDLLVAFVYVETVVTAAPAGWTLFESNAASGHRSYSYYKVATGSEPSTYTWTAGKGVVNILAVQGGKNVAASATARLDSASQIAPSVTPSVATTLLLFSFGFSTGFNVLGDLPGAVALSDWDDGTHASNVLFAPHAEAVATGTRTALMNGVSGEHVATTVAVAGRAAPNAPTLTAPANAAAVDLAAAGNVFDWAFSGDADDTQSAWAMRRKIGAGAYTYYNVGTGVWDASIVWNTDTLTAYTFAAAKWTNGNTYLWSVATKGDSGLESPFASDFSVVANTPSVVTVTGPTSPVTNSSRPPVTWSFTDSESDAQQTFQVKIESGAYSNIPGSGTLKVDSGEISSAGLRTWTPTVDMVNSTTYRAFVRVKTAGLYSAWAFTTFTMSLTLPAAPTLVTTWQSATNRVKIDVTGTHTTAAFPTTTYRVEYSDDAGVTWATVRGGGSLPGSGTPGPTTQTIYDYEAPSYRTRQYRAFTIAEVA